MPMCLDCGLTAEDGPNGQELVLDHACSMRGLYTCVSDIANNTGDHDPALGWEQQWPKRLSTLLVNVGDGTDPDLAVGDNPTFLGSDTNSGNRRQTTDPGQPAVPCPTSAPSFKDNTANVALDNPNPHRNTLDLVNDFDIPVMVEVGAHAWYIDLQGIPEAANGGVRWLGEVRADVRRGLDGPIVAALDWQRAHEAATIITQAPDYDSDPRDIELGATNFVNQLNVGVVGVIDCLTGVIQEQLCRLFTPVEIDAGTPGGGNVGTEGLAWIYPCTDLNTGGTTGGGADYNNDYRSTWGAGRPGGRTHEGQDIFADAGTPAFAIQAGVVTHFNTSTCGLGITLTVADGTRWSYCHMQSVTTANGATVAAGQQIGTVGNSGNATNTPPHVHLELRPGGGAKVDPHQTLRNIWANTCGADPAGEPDEEVPATTPTRTDCRSEAITSCLDPVRTEVAAIAGTMNALRFAISTADNPVPGNPAYLHRRVETGGRWQQTVVLQPGQHLQVQTRTRFANWDANQNSDTVAPLQTHNFCEAEGSSRPGQITFDVMPIAGGRQCDDDQAFLGPFASRQGAENGGDGDVNRNQGTLGS